MAKIKNPTVVIAGGEQPILFAPQVSQSLNVVQWENNSSNGGFSVSLNATLDGTTITSQDNTYAVQESDYGKTFSVVASAASFVSSFSNITLDYFYTITKTVTNGTISGAQSIRKNGTVTLYLNPSSGYIKPNSIIVTGADYVYTKSSGSIELSNPTTNIEIIATCSIADIPTNYLTFSSSSPFTLELKSNDGTKHWNGTINVSPDKETWQVVALSNVFNSGEKDGTYYIYLCGRGVSSLSVRSNYIEYTTSIEIIGTSVDCEGKIASLLDWVDVENGVDKKFPTGYGYTEGVGFIRLFNGCTALRHARIELLNDIALYCYSGMFNGCTSLITPPELPSTQLANFCYNSMFYQCFSMESIPRLNFQGGELPAACYKSMFFGCSNIKMSTTQTEEYANEYIIKGTFKNIYNSGEYPTFNMFTGTGGYQGIQTQFSDYTMNTGTYYTSNTVLSGS